ncbi:MAG: flagellar motor protein MotA, partial [Rhodospirillales bacterium]
MTRPQRFLTRMIVFLVAIAALTAVLSPTLAGAYLASPALNTLILAVMVLGIAYVFRQVVQLRNEVVWLEAWQACRADQLYWEPLLLGLWARCLV